MSRPFTALLRVGLNSSFGFSAARWQYLRRREKLWEPVLILVGLGSLAGMLAFGVYRVALTMTQAGATVGQPELGLGLATLMAQVMVLFLGFFMVVSAFYFAGDLSILVPLPLRPGQIITAKFLTVVAGEYVTIAFIYLPAAAAYIRVSGAGWARLLPVVPVFFMLPVLPLAVAAAAAVLLMRGINRRQRDLLFYAGSILFLVLLVGWQMMLGRATAGDPQQYIYDLIMSRLGLLRAVTSRFPPAMWATLAVTGWPRAEGPLNLVFTAGLSLASLLALGALGERLFYRGLIGGTEVATGARRGAGARAAARGWAGDSPVRRPRTPLGALIWREWVLLLRTPIWVFNNLMPGVIMPVLVFVPAHFQGQLRELIGLLGKNPAATGLALAGMVAFVGGVSGLAATAVSREGRRIWISRVLPQPPRLQAQAKLLMSFAVVAASTVPTVIAYCLLLRPTLFHVLVPAAIGNLAGLSMMGLGLTIDMSRPMLRWTDPQEPVKRNLNALAPMLLLPAYLAVGAVVWRIADGGAFVTYLLCLCLTGGTAAICCRAALARAGEAYARLEI